jgi:alkaline phosphatase D
MARIYQRGFAEPLNGRGKHMSKYTQNRREFMRIVVVGSTAVGLSLPLIGCGDDTEKLPEPLEVGLVYPQGVASGDPTPDSVILWTRVEPGDEATATVTYEVALDEQFSMLVSSGELTVDAMTDHTVRLKITGLEPYTRYYYRFQSRATPSVTGRTKTAPAPDADVAVRFAVASCQDYNGRNYYSWRALAAEPDVDFVLFLGDYIYETAADPRFQEMGGRSVTLPDGLALTEDGEAKAALTLADYRSLYRQYRSDPDLQAMHAMAPFVCTWDDHEFADDSWQDHSTHFNEAQGDEGNNERRTAASRAWYEYQPADVTYDSSATFPNDLSIYRDFRFGKHCELFLTDTRSYRADHIIPEGPDNGAVGKFETNSALGSRNFVLKSGFDEVEAAGEPSMLGDAQKQWLLTGMTGSSATWKVWGNQVQAAQMLIDLSSFDMLPESYRSTFYFSTDQWDGYRSERDAVYGALSGVDNLVALAGDIHAFYASELQADYDNPADPIAVEYVVAGISSTPVQTITQRTVSGNDVLLALGLGDLVPRFDELLQAASPHYKYARSNENGVGIVDLSADAFEMTFLKVNDPTAETFDGQVARTRFRTAAGSRRVELI